VESNGVGVKNERVKNACPIMLMGRVELEKSLGEVLLRDEVN
jgi:hypothetical protein